MFKVVELFDSIEGEGKRAGAPASFIRFAGCNLRCGYCDTSYALFGEAEQCRYTEMSVEDILAKKLKKCITLTGGEPLLQPGLAELCDELLARGHEINIETNGAADIMEFLQELRIHEEDKLFFTIDYKLPSSGAEDKMLWSNFESLMPQDVVKFVVGSDEDYERMLEIVGEMRPLYEEMPQIFIGCVFGAYDARTLCEKIVAEPALEDAHFQLQLHKFIWDPEQRGV